MSFVKPGRVRKKACTQRRPQWDGSVTDFDNYRLSAAEMKQRKEAHKSHNHISVKLEKMRKDKGRMKQTGLTNMEARQLAIMKEVLYDHQQMDTVLQKTDRMMAMVKDLFGDNAQKYTGHPNLTLPPGNHQRSISSLPKPPEIYTRSEKLSESIMNQSALNDMSRESSEGGSDNEDGQRPNAGHFQPQLNIQRFQEYLQHQEENCNSNAIPEHNAITESDLMRIEQLHRILFPTDKAHSNPREATTNQQNLSSICGHLDSVRFCSAEQGPTHSTQLSDKTGDSSATAMLDREILTPGGEQNKCGIQGPRLLSALNDTGKVKKAESKVTFERRKETAPTDISMTNMRQALETLQLEVADFECKTKGCTVPDITSSESFSNYTVSLITAVTKLTRYLKETELHLQAETVVWEQLKQDVRQVAMTLDCVTQELILTREELSKLSSEFYNYQRQMKGQIALLQDQVRSLSHHQDATGALMSANDDRAISNGHAADPSARTAQSSAAVMISPIVRKTRVCHDAAGDLRKTEQQTSLVDIPGLVELRSSRQQHPLQKQVGKSHASSCCSKMGSDLPFLMHALPVIASVCVPRPVPLVQSNVTIPVAASLNPASVSQPLSDASHAPVLPKQGVGTTTAIADNDGILVSNDGPRAIDSQIADLTRQHAEAQRRLQNILEQQKRQRSQLKDDGGEGGPSHMEQRDHEVAVAASPSISPISLCSDHYRNTGHLHQQQQGGPGKFQKIQVSMPLVELEVSNADLDCSL